MTTQGFITAEEIEEGKKGFDPLDFFAYHAYGYAPVSKFPRILYPIHILI